MLEVRGLSKEFPSVVALQDVDVKVDAGEIHGVIGENGAGKSTLMKIISGLYIPTKGEVFVDDKLVNFRGTPDAIKAGIAMIHQELNLVDELTVAENIFLGREPTKGIAIDRGRMVAEAQGYLSQVAATFSPTVKVGDLTIANKQLVEIAKALSYKARLLIMDEPTAVLSERETTALFALVRQLKADGVTILYISHLLNEMISLCDRITVLRDGKKIATVDASSVTPATLANLMVGRELEDFYPAKLPAPTGAPALEVEGLSVPGFVRDFTFSVKPGELVGIAGLIGAGRTEAAEAIVGLRSKTAGTIKRNGNTVTIKSPADAMKLGIAYVSEDRKHHGLILGMSTAHNTTLANLSKYAHPIVNASMERASVSSWVESLQIRVGDVDAAVANLSGGNQQKVSVAKWLDTKPQVLILDEPTRGVDVGAKREIYNLIVELAREGLACVMISSEMPELIGICHRILVLREGRLMGELDQSAMTEENIMMLAAGVEKAA